MTIYFLSTYKTECGIATYTEHLVRALARTGVNARVFSERQNIGGNGVSSDGSDIPVWRRGAPYEAPFGLNEVVRRVRPGDIVHIQHEYGLFPRTDDVVKLIYELKKQSVKTVITLHTVDPVRVRSLKKLERSGAEILVHSDEALCFVGSRTIPHGVPVLAGEQRDLNRILVPGFVSKNKNTLEILKLFSLVVNEGITSHKLVVSGLCRDHLYEGKLREFVARRDLESLVEFNLGFLYEEKFNEELLRATCVVLGSRGPTDGPDVDLFYSASGQFHSAIGAGVPIVAKRVPIYCTAPYAGCLYYEDPASGAAMVKAMCRANGLRWRLAEQNKRVREAMSWDVVAKKHMRVYEGL